MALTLAGCSQPTNGSMTPPSRPPATSAISDVDDPGEHATAEAVVWSGQRAIAVGSSGRSDAEPVTGNPVFVDGAKYHGWIRAMDDRGGAAWGRRLEGGREVHVRAVAALGGDLVLAGELRAGTARAFTGWVARVAPDGEPRWRLDALGTPGATGLSAVAVRGDGVIAAAGVQRGKAWLVAVDGQGKLIWQRDVDGLDEATALIAAGDGVVVAGVTGRTTTSAGTSRIVALDAGGRARWSAEAAERGHGELYAIAALAGGGIAVGQAPGEGGRDGAWLVRFGGDGAIRSSEVLPAAGPGKPIDAARAVAAFPDGGFVVAGESLDSLAGRRARVWRFDAAGKLLWHKAYGDGESLVRGVAVTPDGGAVIAGATQAIGAPLRAWIFEIDPHGAPRWTAR
jgi:hypothetical protein